METETIDKLFLELSQFTKAKTKREIVLEDEVWELKRILRLTCDKLVEAASGSDTVSVAEFVNKIIKKSED